MANSGAIKAFLDAHFTDEESLAHAGACLSQLIERKQDLHKKRLAVEKEAREGVARVRQVAEEASLELANLQKSRGELSLALSKHAERQQQSGHHLKQDLAQLLLQIDKIQEVQRYIQLLIHVDHLREQITQHVSEEAAKSAVELLLQLLSIKKALAQRSCSHLAQHVSQTFDQCLERVVSLLRARLSSSFEPILWPRLPAPSQPLNPPLPDSTALQSFRKAFSLLLLIQLSAEGLGLEKESEDESKGDIREEAGGTCLWGIQLMLNPVVKRFRYHFMSKRPTNNIEKPEWYLIDTREVIRINTDFLVREVQPLLEKKNLGYYSAKTEFMKGLVVIIKEKITKDIDAISRNEATFVHNLNETLSFHKALVGACGYPDERWIKGWANPPCALDVYTDHLDRWLSLEEKLAADHFEAMLMPSAEPWSLYYSLASLTASGDARLEDLDLHEMKPTKSAHALVATLSSVTERYCTLPRLSHRLRFMHEIQITLLARYLAKVKQTFNGLMGAMNCHQFAQVCGLINSLNYCEAVVKDWGEQLFFIQLRQGEILVGDSEDYARADAEPTQECADPNDTVFDEVVLHYRGLRNDITGMMMDVVLQSFKALTGPYISKKRIWKHEFDQDHQEPSEHPSLDLSPGICEGLLRMRKDMAELQSHLADPVFAKVWPEIASRLNSFVFSLIMSRRHHFQRWGALQFQHDMKALFLIFRDFTPVPHNLFQDVKEATTVLTLSAEARERVRGLLAPLLATPAACEGVSLLGQGDAAAESAGDAQGRGDTTAESFARMGLFKLTPSQIELILSLRIDHPI